MTVEDFLQARLTEDADLPIDDIRTKVQIVGLYRDVSSSPELDRDAWIVVREIVFLLCQRYAHHPDFNQAWKPVAPC